MNRDRLRKTQREREKGRMDGFWFFLHTHSPDFIPFPLLYGTNSIDGIHSSEETMGLFVFFFRAKGGFERGMLEDGWEELGGEESFKEYHVLHNPSSPYL